MQPRYLCLVGKSGVTACNQQQIRAGRREGSLPAGPFVARRSVTHTHHSHTLHQASSFNDGDSAHPDTFSCHYFVCTVSLLVVTSASPFHRPVFHLCKQLIGQWV